MTVDVRDTNLQHVKRNISILLFSALFIAGASFNQPVDYDNTSSRYFLLSAIVDHGTFNIDVDEKGTVDKSLFNGHYYSNKAVGAPFLGAPVYWCLRHLPYLNESTHISPVSKYVVRVFTTTLPFALLGVVMFRIACRIGATPIRALLMVIAYGFGTIALVHATLFSGHQMAASFAFFSFALVLQQAENGLKRNELIQSIRFFVAGLFAGFAAITDFPAIIIAFFLAIYVCSTRQPVRYSLMFSLGGLICAILLVWYNIKCFGSPVSLSYSHLSLEKFRDEASGGLFGIHLPRLSTMTALLFSPARGIFIIMPVLVLSFSGIWAMIAGKQHRREIFLIIAICLAYLVFNSGYCGWHGGWTFGPRYLVPMLPFLVFTIAFGRWNYFLFLLYFLLSAFQILSAVAGMPHTPEDIRNPLIEIIIPCMGQGYLAQNAGMLLKLPGLLSIVPIMALMGLLIFIALRNAKVISDHEPESASKFSKLILYPWILVVVCLLAFTKTEPENIIHAYRWRLLCHAGWTIKAPELLKASECERVLAGEANR